MTRYAGLEPRRGGDDVVAVDMEDGHHELRGFYDLVRLEIDGEVLTLRSRGRDGDSTSDISLHDRSGRGCPAMVTPGAGR